MDYEEFFGLKDSPFRLTPDPDYFYPSEVHQEALSTLHGGIKARDWFIQITGEPGTGKTTLLKTLLRQLGENVVTARIFNPGLSPEELLAVLVEDLGRDPDELPCKTREELRRLFNRILDENITKDLTTVVVIDEAQNLPIDTLEELRVLSNLEPDKAGRLKIILVGQVHLENKLNLPELKQLEQRITSRARLEPLSRADTNTYIQHRLHVAGGTGKGGIFPVPILDEVYRLSGGVPRLINIIVERTLMAACVDEKHSVEKSHLKKAMESVGMEKSPDPRLKKPAVSRGLALGLAALVVLALIVGGWYFLYFKDGRTPPATPDRTAEGPASTSPPSPPPSPPTTPPATSASPPAAPAVSEPPFAEPGAAPVEPAPAPGQPAPAAEPAAPPTPAPGPAVPMAPSEAVYVPTHETFMSVDRSKNAAYLWRGDASGPSMKAEFQWPEPPPPGLFIIGESVNKKPFIFQFPAEGKPNLPVTEVWAELKDLVPGRALPVLSYAQPGETVDVDRIEKAKAVAGEVKEWAAAWQNKDPEAYIKYYGDTFKSYTAGSSAPKIYSKKDYHQVKKSVFKRSGPITLTISDPVCVMDPLDPNRAVAVFYQRYESEVYSDEGTQVLFFEFDETAPEGGVWKIMAKLWVEHKG